MATNTLLTPVMITREALRILHQKLNFIGSITRGYDDSFAKTGAKIGDTLKIRLPNQYTVRTGAAFTGGAGGGQNTTESSVSLQIATQKGVDVNFSSTELTLSLDDFSKRILQPAMSVLAAAIESDALNTMLKDVYNAVKVVNATPAMTFTGALQARKVLVDNLAPPGPWTATLNTQHNVDLVDALKGLFQDSEEIASQYRDGMVGRTAGFNWYENTLLQNYAESAANGAYLTNGATQTGSVLNVDTGANAPSAGDVFTIAGVFRVHPETKVSTGVLQQFVIQAGSTTTVWNISPAIVPVGTGNANVSNSAADNSAITFLQVASSSSPHSLLFQEGAFSFASADLVMPDGVDFAARQVMDGISMRIVRAYDIVNDQFPCRLDVLYGFKTLRPQLACRLFAATA